MPEKVEYLNALRNKLLENGWIPIPNIDKQPGPFDWQKLTPTPELIRRWGRSTKWLATGVRIEPPLAVIDSDIADPQAQVAVRRAWEACFPWIFDDCDVPLLERGNTINGKLAYFVRCDEPFGRIHSARWRQPGADEDDPGAVIEIFGGASPRQFGAYGPHQHDSSGQVISEYVWTVDAPESVPVAALPTMPKAALFRLLDIAEATLKRLGWTKVERSAKGESWPAQLYDLVPELRFDCSDGMTRTMEELKAAAGGSMRCSTSWKNRGSNRQKCTTGLDHDGGLYVHDFEDDVTHHEAQFDPFATVSIPILPNLPEGEIRQAPKFSEGGVALVFIEQYHRTLRHVTGWGWMAWDGKVWVRDPRIAFHKAHQVALAVSGGTPTERKTLATKRFAQAVLDIARADPLMAGKVAEWDVDPMALNTPGGVVDLSSGLMRPHDPDDRMTRMTAVAPDGQVKTPLWDRFMAEVTGGNAALQSFLREVEGYLLTGLTDEHAMFFLWGEGGNGKSTYVGTIGDIMGSYRTVAAPDMLMAVRYQAHPTELAAIRGARLVTASETEQGRHWAEAKVKAMTGGDRLTARFMREDFFDFDPTHKLVVIGNHKPMLYAVDTAIRRRFNLILFVAKIAVVNLRLREDLVAEWPGIIHRMIQGGLAWQISGLRQPDCVAQATDDYMEAEDVRGAWMAERTERRGRTSFVQSDVLYADWRRWAEARGEQPGPMKALVEYIAGHGIRQHKTKHARGFIGLALVGTKPLSSLEVVENKDENDEK